MGHVGLYMAGEVEMPGLLDLGAMPSDDDEDAEADAGFAEDAGLEIPGLLDWDAGQVAAGLLYHLAQTLNYLDDDTLSPADNLARVKAHCQNYDQRGLLTIRGTPIEYNVCQIMSLTCIFVFL